MWDCTRCNYCVEVCPKDVKPMEAIIRLRRAAIQQGLVSTGGARHITGFTELIEENGRLNETRMPLKVIGLNLRRAWQVLPLALKMFRRGKLPRPFGHGIPGVHQVRSIFATVRAAKPAKSKV
jgi:succinate dehydrogenase / fumarate reductase iron-sulfur subunit